MVSIGRIGVLTTHTPSTMQATNDLRKCLAGTPVSNISLAHHYRSHLRHTGTPPPTLHVHPPETCIRTSFKLPCILTLLSISVLSSLLDIMHVRFSHHAIPIFFPLCEYLRSNAMAMSEYTPTDTDVSPLCHCSCALITSSLEGHQVIHNMPRNSEVKDAL